MTQPEKSYSHIDKTGWGPGPWEDEPDKVQWIDRATDLDCLAVRAVSTGAWCGYVGLPPGHRFHGAHYDDVDVVVHGGLTYAGLCQEDAPEYAGVCHVPAPGRPARVYWLGFDCAHFMDRCPAYAAFERAHGISPPPDLLHAYRDLVYVRAEVLRLAEQLA